MIFDTGGGKCYDLAKMNGISNCMVFGFGFFLTPDAVRAEEVGTA